MNKLFVVTIASSLVSVQALAQDMSEALRSACQPNRCLLTDVSRTLIQGDVAHYSATLKVGTGSHDVIGIHRVVREKSPWKPRPTPRNLFLVHGDSLNFNAAYMIGPDAGSPSSSIAAFLASRNVDVWGIDLRWAKVPEDTSNFDFMATWNMETDVRDARIAILVARAVRAVTGSGFHKMKYLGWSRGGQIGYVLAQQESQLPASLRSIDGLVPVDTLLKTDNEPFRQTVCGITADIEQQIASGIYQEAGGATIRAVGTLAQIDPSGESPIFPGLTNIQVVLLFGGATFQFNPYLPTYHLVAAAFDSNQVPTGLLYSDQAAFVHTTTQVSPYESKGTMLQGDAVVCGDTPLDDHLADVTLPVLYIGAQGGFGAEGIYTTTLLGSNDVEVLNIQLRPDTERLFDYGHDDVIRAPSAKQLVWQPLLDWLAVH